MWGNTNCNGFLFEGLNAHFYISHSTKWSLSAHSVDPLVAGKYWLHQALSSFRSSLERIGSHLVFLEVNGSTTLRTLKELVKETGARTVLANALYEPWLKERDDEVVSRLQKDGVRCKMFHSYCKRDPYSVSTEGVGLRGASNTVQKVLSVLSQENWPTTAGDINDSQTAAFPLILTWSVCWEMKTKKHCHW